MPVGLQSARGVRQRFSSAWGHKKESLHTSSDSFRVFGLRVHLMPLGILERPCRFGVHSWTFLTGM
jgi:hypothetical protein